MSVTVVSRYPSRRRPTRCDPAATLKVLGVEFPVAVPSRVTGTPLGTDTTTNEAGPVGTGLVGGFLAEHPAVTKDVNRRST
jgi:hypothetical protein